MYNPCNSQGCFNFECENCFEEIGSVSIPLGQYKTHSGSILLSKEDNKCFLFFGKEHYSNFRGDNGGEAFMLENPYYIAFSSVEDMKEKMNSFIRLNEDSFDWI